MPNDGQEWRPAYVLKDFDPKLTLLDIAAMKAFQRDQGIHTISSCRCGLPARGGRPCHACLEALEAATIYFEKDQP